MENPRAIGVVTVEVAEVVILERVRVVNLEVDGVLTPELTGKLTLTNKQVSQTIVGRITA